MNPQELRALIIEQFGLGSYSPKDQDEAVEKISDLVFQRALMEAMDAIPENDQSAFDALLEQNPEPQIVLDYIINKVPTFGDIFAREMQAIQEELGTMGESATPSA
jgi:hypothetical protein